jgi:apolipoprotein N-acyltransferase
VLICYEDILPDLVREVTRATGAQLLVNVTNDAWFGDTAAPHIHLALATLRTIEQRRFLVRATNSGVSAIVGPTGRVLRTLPMFQPATLRTRVALLSITTLYARIGDLAGYLAVAGCAFMIGVRRRDRARAGADGGR